MHVSFSRTLLCTLLLPIAAIAAPVNDHFVNRIALGNGVTASATGTNLAATLQAGENDLDSIGGASVWWKWTAPATDWVSVDTIGSEIDTVLAVLADGPTLNDTFIVGFNDESGDPAAPFGTSRVVFRATAGTEYHLAVHGFLGAQGNVALNIEAGITPPIRVTALSLSPTSVNVTAAAQTVTVDIGLECGAGFAEGELAIYKAGFTGVLQIPLAVSNRIAGTSTAGLYRVTFSVARYSTPGTWFLELAASDDAGAQAVFGRGVSAVFEYDHVLPDGLPGLFAVANTGAVDSAEPVLVTFALSPAAVNVVAAPATLTFTFRITDALAGFGSATLTLFTPAGEALTALPITAAHRFLGTALDGTYSVSFSLPPRMPSGVWSATLLIRDATGNPALYDGAVNGLDFPLGPTSAEWTVTGVAHHYWAWMYPQIATTPGALPAQDFDGDGIPNVLEFAFGLSASENDSGNATLNPGFDASGLPAVSRVGPQLRLDYVRRIPPTSVGLTYTAQFGDLSGAWLDVAGGLVVPAGETFERVTITDPVPSPPRRVGRVRVTLAE